MIELTELCELEGWPTDMRMICRRERPHPGAQLSLFDTHAGWRHTCFITNTEGDDIAALELRHRGHARVEDRVRCWKACGLANLPFDGFCANEAWVAVSLIAGALLAWSQMTCFDGALAKAEPKTMRYRVLHVAAVLAHRGRDLIVRSRRDLALGQRAGHRLHAPTRRLPIARRVPAPDPEAILQGVTTPQDSSDQVPSRPRCAHTAIIDSTDRSTKAGAVTPEAGRMIEARRSVQLTSTCRAGVRGSQVRLTSPKVMA